MLKVIQQLMREGKYRFTFKAEMEMARDWIEGEDIVKAILEVDRIYKSINSYNPQNHCSEKLYVIKNDGLYIKGKVAENFVLISCKLDTDTK